MTKPNYKLTRQRKIILEELCKLTSHPTAEELYEIIKKKMPEIGLATIYRNLEKFQEVGIIEKIHGKQQRFDGNLESHNHIKCTKCGKVEDIDFEIELDKSKIAQRGYKLNNYNLEINGICQSCQ